MTDPETCERDCSKKKELQAGVDSSDDSLVSDGGCDNKCSECTGDNACHGDKYDFWWVAMVNYVAAEVNLLLFLFPIPRARDKQDKRFWFFLFKQTAGFSSVILIYQSKKYYKAVLKVPDLFYLIYAVDIYKLLFIFCLWIHLGNCSKWGCVYDLPLNRTILL